MNYLDTPSELPLTGNIYRERFYDGGRDYVDYSADCAVCGEETAIFLSRADGRRCATWLRRKGWRQPPPHHKWVYPRCLGVFEISVTRHADKRTAKSAYPHAVFVWYPFQLGGAPADGRSCGWCAEQDNVVLDYHTKQHLIETYRAHGVVVLTLHRDGTVTARPIPKEKPHDR